MECRCKYTERKGAQPHLGKKQACVGEWEIGGRRAARERQSGNIFFSDRYLATYSCSTTVLFLLLLQKFLDARSRSLGLMAPAEVRLV